jgi:hypothetical protein
MEGRRSRVADYNTGQHRGLSQFSSALPLGVFMQGAAAYAARARASMRTPTVLGMSAPGADSEKIVRQRVRRSEARASAKEGVFFDWYQGSEGQESFVPCVVRYQYEAEE